MIKNIYIIGTHNSLDMCVRLCVFAVDRWTPSAEAAFVQIFLLLVSSSGTYTEVYYTSVSRISRNFPWPVHTVFVYIIGATVAARVYNGIKLDSI